MAKSKDFYRRAWLNKRRGKAFVECYVEDGYGGDRPYSSMTIADCNRQITLDFNVTKEQPLEAVKHKIGVLRSALDTMEAEIETRCKAA